jgi:hypothetical protein
MKYFVLLHVIIIGLLCSSMSWESRKWVVQFETIGNIGNMPYLKVFEEVTDFQPRAGYCSFKTKQGKLVYISGKWKAEEL